MILGFSGYGESGKDTAAESTTAFGYIHMAFADAMRSMAWEINPIVGWDFEAKIKDGPIRYREAIDECGYQESKTTYPEIRRFLQRLGTDAGREGPLGENIWVDATARRVHQEGYFNVAISDVRFPNEAQWIKGTGGKVIRINRSGVGPANGHPSEVALDGWDFDRVFTNDGTIPALAMAVSAYARTVRTAPPKIGSARLPTID